MVGEIQPFPLLLEIGTFAQLQLLDAVAQVVNLGTHFSLHRGQQFVAVRYGQEANSLRIIVLDGDEHAGRPRAIELSE